MGGGLERKDSIPRRTSRESRNLLRAVKDLGIGIEVNGGPVGGEEGYCSREHRLPFTITAPVAPAAGTEIELTDGDPPRLVGDDGEIGVIEARQTAIRDCLLGDWKMAGTIAALDASAGIGVVVVSGRQ